MGAANLKMFLTVFCISVLFGSVSVANIDAQSSSPVLPTTPTFERPTTPTFERPTAPTFERPTAPTFERPTTPTFERPTAPTFERPTAPTFERPTAPTFERPTAPTFERPTAPTFERPTAPTFEKPTIPTTMTEEIAKSTADPKPMSEKKCESGTVLVDGYCKVIEEKPTGFWNWLLGLFGLV